MAFDSIDDVLVRVATAAAPVPPPPPVKKTVGAAVYPLPGFVIVRLFTIPVVVAVALAPDPPPPEMDTVGMEVYPVPPFVTAMPVTLVSSRVFPVKNTPTLTLPLQKGEGILKVTHTKSKRTLF